MTKEQIEMISEIMRIVLAIALLIWAIGAICDQWDARRAHQEWRVRMIHTSDADVRRVPAATSSPQPSES